MSAHPFDVTTYCALLLLVSLLIRPVRTRLIVPKMAHRLAVLSVIAVLVTRAMIAVVAGNVALSAIATFAFGMAQGGILIASFWVLERHVADAERRNKAMRDQFLDHFTKGKDRRQS